MEELRRAYSRLCQQSGAEPQEAVLQRLLQPPRGRLDLATQSLTVDSCRALGKLLRAEALLTELVLSDCMLSEEGAALLLRGLCANTAVRLLDLKGNNLRAGGAEALGRLLRQNKSIQSLTLEWNSLGAWEDAFAAFCGGLAANEALLQLDLRNNQVSHQGAEQLALALKGNATLQQLDLRWNNIGLLGGRALVSCFPSNRSLRRLDLAGNNVPGDILRAVGRACVGCWHRALSPTHPGQGRLGAATPKLMAPATHCHPQLVLAGLQGPMQCVGVTCVTTGGGCSHRAQSPPADGSAGPQVAQAAARGGLGIVVPEGGLCVSVGGGTEPVLQPPRCPPAAKSPGQTAAPRGARA